MIARVNALTKRINALDPRSLENLKKRVADLNERQRQLLSLDGRLGLLKLAVDEVHALRKAIASADQELQQAVREASEVLENVCVRLEAGVEDLLERLGALPDDVAERLTEAVDAAVTRIEDQFRERVEAVIERVVDEAVNNLLEKATEAQVRCLLSTQLAQVMAPYMPQMQAVRLGLPALKRLLNPVG